MTKILLLILLIFSFSSVSQAVVINGFATGVITDRAETRGIGNEVFGLDGDDLRGKPFVIDFTYNTTKAPLTTFLDFGVTTRSIYTSSDPNFNWLDLSLTVNSQIHNVVGFNRQADITDNGTDAFGQLSYDSFNLGLEGFSGAVNSPTFFRQFLEFNAHFPLDTLNSSSLPVMLNSNEIIPQNFRDGSFAINETDFDPDTGEVLFQRVVRLGLDINSIEVSAIGVPEPSSYLLLGVGLLGLVSISRKYPFT